MLARTRVHGRDARATLDYPGRFSSFGPTIAIVNGSGILTLPRADAFPFANQLASQ